MTHNDADSEIIIKAISNEIRRNIIRLLIGKNMSYSEIAHLLNFNLKKESGKFNFHLKELVKAGLIDNNTSDESYQLTDKGSEMYYLLVDIERDTEIDPHGMMTALIRLDGMREFYFFLASISIVGTLQSLMIGLLALFGLPSYLPLRLYGGFLVVMGVIGLIYSSRYYFNTVGELLGDRTTFSKAISSIFFLSIQWYFIRGKTRLSYLFATTFVLMGWMLSIMSILFGISHYGGLEDFGNELYIISGIAATAALLGIFLLRRLYVQATLTEKNKVAKSSRHIIE